jgi:hypothetical protein
MGTDGYKGQMNDLLFKYIIISNKEKCNIQQCIKATTGRITVGLMWHELSKNWIEKINHG